MKIYTMPISQPARALSWACAYEGPASLPAPEGCGMALHRRAKSWLQRDWGHMLSKGGVFVRVSVCACVFGVCTVRTQSVRMYIPM